MTKRTISLSWLAVAAGMCLAGVAIASSMAGPPPGEPAIPGVLYAPGGVGAPYLPSTGAPRHFTGLGINQLGGPLQAQATAAGIQAGKAAGPKITKPLKLVVGEIDIVGGIESADRESNAQRVAFQHVGAKYLYCDGAGSPTKWVTCGQSLIAQGANVLIASGIDPTSISAVVRAAKQKNIPIVDCCGSVGPGYQVAMSPNEKLKGTILAKYLQAKLKSLPGTQNIVTIDYPATWATDRTDQLRALVKTDPHLKISQALTTDPTNLVAGTQKQVADAITADPNLKAIWISFDVPGQVAGSVVQSKFAGKQFPHKPLVVTFHADPSTQRTLRSGAIDAVVDSNWDATAWEMVNAVAEHFARGTAYPAYTNHATYPGIGNPQVIQIVTRKNLPKPGTYVLPKVDTVSYFISKWKTEGFGN